MGVYYVNGLGGPISSFNANEPYCALWNPSADRRIWVVEAYYYICDFLGLGDTTVLMRTSTRGTPASTVTPDVDNAGEFDSAPPSGALLDLAEYSVLPTFSTPELAGLFAPSGTGVGSEGGGSRQQFPRKIAVPPGGGLAICMTVGENMSGTWECGFVFED